MQDQGTGGGMAVGAVVGRVLTRPVGNGTFVAGYLGPLVANGRGNATISRAGLDPPLPPAPNHKP